IATLTDEAGRVIEARPLARLLTVMEFADVASSVTDRFEQRRPGHIVRRKWRVIVRHAVEMAIAASQINGAAGSAQRIDDERVPEANAFAGQSIEIRRLEPWKAGLVALLALHDSERVVT